MAYNYSTVLGDAARLSGSMDPTTLANNTGDGEVVYFGGPNGGLAEGALYYLKNDGNWASASAEATPQRMWSILIRAAHMLRWRNGEY